jgi:hypothetical protein
VLRRARGAPAGAAISSSPPHHELSASRIFIAWTQRTRARRARRSRSISPRTGIGAGSSCDYRRAATIPAGEQQLPQVEALTKQGSRSRRDCACQSGCRRACPRSACRAVGRRPGCGAACLPRAHEEDDAFSLEEKVSYSARASETRRTPVDRIVRVPVCRICNTTMVARRPPHARASACAVGRARARREPACGPRRSHRARVVSGGRFVIRARRSAGCSVRRTASCALHPPITLV